MLSDRRQRILCALIEEYVAHALPVGSQTIAKQYQLGVSSATIRNELSQLEEEGYITQPHTSAGRIPTDAGYREFVDELLSTGSIFEDNSYASVVSDLRRHADALDDLMERTSAELTRLTDCLSIVMPPSLALSKIRQVSFISLSNTQALIVVVLQDGQVMNHAVNFPFEVSAERLGLAQEKISAFLVGRTPSDALGYAEGDGMDPAADAVVPLILDELVGLLRDGGERRSTRVGMTSLMRKPEFHDSSALLPIMEVLEDDTVLFRSFTGDADSQEGIVVRIGTENSTEQLSGVSVVAASYGRGEAQGFVAVVGPKRMDYSHVIRAVNAARDALGDAS